MPKEKLIRKRTRNVGEWINVKAKSKLNFGIGHVNKAGKLKKKTKEIGPPCECRMNCVNVSEEIRKTIFDEYWKLGDHNT